MTRGYVYTYTLYNESLSLSLFLSNEDTLEKKIKRKWHHQFLVRFIAFSFSSLARRESYAIIILLSFSIRISIYRGFFSSLIGDLDSCGSLALR